jgi:hypothetical protein
VSYPAAFSAHGEPPSEWGQDAQAGAASAFFSAETELVSLALVPLALVPLALVPLAADRLSVE